MTVNIICEIWAVYYILNIIQVDVNHAELGVSGRISEGSFLTHNCSPSVAEVMCLVKTCHPRRLGDK